MFTQIPNAVSEPTTEPIVAVVDDDRSIRALVEVLVDTADAACFAGGVKPRVICFHGGRSLLEWLDAERDAGRAVERRTGCVLLDQSMPDLSGDAVQRELSDRQLPWPTVFLTAHADVETTLQVMRQGAVDLLQKPFDREVLVDRVRHALAIDARRLEWQVQRDEAAERFAQLTPREAEVLRHVAAGLANKQVARELSISERTVEVHRRRGFTKIGAEGVADAVRTCALLGELAGPPLHPPLALPGGSSLVA